ncbi:TPA: ISNCY family transposase, partial [Escherichia coli]|nr:ISNCY family transposase [Escherichia coli]
IKETSLQSIFSISQSNQWIMNFMSDFNCRFSRPAKYTKDLYLPIIHGTQELDDIFACQELWA